MSVLNPKNIRNESTINLSFPSADFINRRTDFRFAGCTISLDLSLGLFSSAGVDGGSMLLLKSIAKDINFDSLKSVLDIGCGTGTLGLALASRCPDTSVTMVDRDTMAIDFTRHNAEINKLTNVQAHTRLMTEGPHRNNYDLVISNFPAKAGDAVIRDYLQQSMNLISSNGRCGMVIVRTLADRVKELITDVGGEIILEDASKQHTVFHYRRGTDNSKRKTEELSLIPYIRHHGEFKIKRTHYELDTVWNIDDFDSISWRIKLLGDMLDSSAVKGNMVFWGSGQGHFPVAICRRHGARPGKIILADRDTLSLRITERNIAALFPDLHPEILNIADPSLLHTAIEPESVDFLLTDLSPVPRSDWTDALKASAASLLVPGGRWAVVARSNDMAALLKHSKGWTSSADRRNKGWRAVILTKNS